MRGILVAIMLFMPSAGWGQWQILDGHTTADLRGVDNVGKGVVWVSGTNGTVLRSEDDGYMWQGCTVPPGAEKLDFRGIQAFDANVAIVMSSGPGDASRLYKTTDGCQSWKLLFVNPDKDGFWDAIAIAKSGESFILGDPVGGEFRVFCQMGDSKWGEGCSQDSFHAKKDEAAFAASNSSLLIQDGLCFITGGSLSEMICRHNGVYGKGGKIIGGNRYVALPMALGTSAGAFSIAQRDSNKLLVVGGDYKKPNGSLGTAAFSGDSGKSWSATTTPPHGYRSAVVYDPDAKTWITVGPNGTDVSVDDGRNWRALKPDMRIPGAQVDEDRRWNALSLPFVVGPGGRIGMLRPEALKGR